MVGNEICMREQLMLSEFCMLRC